MKYLFLSCVLFFNLYSLGYVKDIEDSVHVKIGEKIYFASDFINLQQAIVSRLCAENDKLSFLDLIGTFLKNKNITTDLSRKNFSQNQSHLKKNELEALVLVFKLIQILVDQQVSFQGSTTAAIPDKCLDKQTQSPSKVTTWYQKLVFLDNLLEVKANVEKDQVKKKSSLINIIDSLDKQIKHEVMAKIE